MQLLTERCLCTKTEHYRFQMEFQWFGMWETINQCLEFSFYKLFSIFFQDKSIVIATYALCGFANFGTSRKSYKDKEFFIIRLIKFILKIKLELKLQFWAYLHLQEQKFSLNMLLKQWLLEISPRLWTLV